MSITPQRIKIMSEVLTISTGSSVVGKSIDMTDAPEITYCLSMGTAVPLTQVVAKVLQSADEGMSTSAGVGGTTLAIGSGTSHVISNALQATITISSATTTGDNVVVNGSTFTFSTVASATALQYGSTAGTTAAGGIDGAVTSLTSLINANCAGLRATTISTAALRIRANSTSSTTVNITGTTNAAVAHEKSQGFITVRANDLGSTSKFIALSLSSQATAVQVGVAAVKYRPRYSPSTAIQGVSTMAS